METEMDPSNPRPNQELALKILQEKTAYAFEGGGVLGIGHAGALVRLFELGGMAKKTHLVGTSVGSIITMALACGASSDYIQEKMVGLDLKKFEDGGNIIRKICRFIFKFGWHRGNTIEMFAEEILEDLGEDPNITFRQAYDKYGYHSTITYLSVRHKKTKYADYINTPDLPIKVAVRWSSTIPYFYKPVRYYRRRELIDMIVDGGVMDNYPIHVLREQGCDPVNILGFKLCGTDEFNEYTAIKNETDDEDVDYGIPHRNIKKYSLTMIDILRHQALRYHVHKEDWKLTCKINIGSFTTTDFDMREQDKIWLFEEGRKAIDNYLAEIEELLDQGIYPL